MEEDDDDDDETALMPRALYVDDLPPNLTGPPQTAEEYLRRVRWEARSVADVVVAPNRERRQLESVADPLPEPFMEGIPAAPSFAASSVEWEDDVLEEFAALGRKLVGHRSKMDAESSNGIDLPGPADEPRWRRMCFAESSKQAPLVKVIAQIDPRCSAAVVRHFDRWLTDEVGGESSTSACLQAMKKGSRAEWLFALLASVDRPVDAETAGSMRSLLRRFAVARAHASAEQSTELAPISVFIALLGRHFDQGG